MRTVDIFEVPVYQLSKEKQREKFKKLLKRNISYFKENYSEDDAIKLAKNSLRGLESWRYNDIVGVVLIKIDKQDITLELYKQVPKLARGIAKKRLVYCYTAGSHFRIIGKDNISIFTELMEQVLSMEDHFDKHAYIDSTALKNIGKYLDYNAVLSTLSEES